MKLIDSTAQTNWKFLAIILAVTLFVGGGVLFLQIQGEDAGMEQEEQMQNRWPPEDVVQLPGSETWAYVNRLVVLGSGQDVGAIVEELGGEITYFVQETDTYEAKFPVSSLQELDGVKNQLNEKGIQTTYSYVMQPGLPEEEQGELPPTLAVEEVPQATPEVDEEVFITLLSPNGDETWTIGEETTVRWEVENAPPDSYVELNISTADPTRGGIPVLRGAPSENGMAVVYVPDSNCGVGGGDTCATPFRGGNNYRASARLYTGQQFYCTHLCPAPNDPPIVFHASDTGDASFEIKPSSTPTIYISSPSSGRAGTEITARGVGFTKTDNKILFRGQEITNASSENGTVLRFTVPVGTDPGSHIFWVANANGTTKTGVFFTVTDGSVGSSLTVLSPNGGETFVIGKKYPITWGSENVEGVTAHLYKGLDFERSLFVDPLNSGTGTWTVPVGITPGADYFIRILASSYYSYFDDSDGYFSIVEAP